MDKIERAKLQRKYQNKRVNAQKENILFRLTFEDFLKLADEANITSKEMCIKGYHLSRRNDKGSYEIGNCRFIPYGQNYSEKKISKKSRIASAENVKKAYAELNGEKKKIHQSRAKVNRKKWWDSLSEKEKREFLLENHDNTLTDQEIKRRHDVIRSIPDCFGRLAKASKILGLTPQVIGRFLKKYPIK